MIQDRECPVCGKENKCSDFHDPGKEIIACYSCINCDTFYDIIFDQAETRIIEK